MQTKIRLSQISIIKQKILQWATTVNKWSMLKKKQQALDTTKLWSRFSWSWSVWSLHWKVYCNQDQD